MKESREDLSKLYPTPKTFDEIYKEKAEREEMFMERLPKHVAKGGAIYSLCFLFPLILLLAKIRELWFTYQLFGITISFLFVIMIFFIGKGFIAYISRTFYAYDIATGVFWLIYIMILGATLACSLSAAQHIEQYLFGIILTIALIHSCFAYILIKFFVKN